MKPFPNFPPDPPVAGRRVIYGEGRKVLGILGLTEAEFHLLRQNGRLTLASRMPSPRGPLKPDEALPAAYCSYQCTIMVERGSILRCVAGAEHMTKLEHFESRSAALKRIGGQIERQEDRR